MTRIFSWFTALLVIIVLLLMHCLSVVSLHRANVNHMAVNFVDVVMVDN